MENKMLFVANHTITPQQVDDFKGSIVELSEIDSDLSKILAQIPATADVGYIDELVDRINNHLVIGGFTHVSVSGEPALVCRSYVRREIGVKFLQPTTTRDSVEKVMEDGSVVKQSIFRHVQWREI